MDVSARLIDLPGMHPRLLWDPIATAAAAVLLERQPGSELRVRFDLRSIPEFGSGELVVNVGVEGIRQDEIERLRRTFEPSRQIELAAIALTAIVLHEAGGHEIRDLAVRGSSADYLVDEEGYHLEIAGRSRRVDLTAAWDQRVQRLARLYGEHFLVSVVEFETYTGRLGFGG